jgi:hypothetical protein
MLNNASIVATKSRNMDWLIRGKQQTQKCTPTGANHAMWRVIAHTDRTTRNVRIICISPTGEVWKKKSCSWKSWTPICLGQSCSLLTLVVAGLSWTLSIQLTQMIHLFLHLTSASTWTNSVNLTTEPACSTGTLEYLTITTMWCKHQTEACH